MLRPLRWVCAAALALACSSEPTVFTLTSDKDSAKADGADGINLTASVTKGEKYLDRGEVTFTVDTDGVAFKPIASPDSKPTVDQAKTIVPVSAGEATLRLYSVTRGRVTVTAVFKDEVAKTSDRKTITLSFTAPLIPLAAFEYLGATPSPVPIGGSAALKFLAKSSGGEPIANLPVTFALAPEGAATLAPSGETGNDGTVTAILNAGQSAASVRVTISGGAGEYQRSAESDPIAISGGILNGRNMTLGCTHYSIAGFEKDGLETECTVYGSDNNNAFVQGSQVLFMTEAGGVPAAVSFSSDPAHGGVAKFTYRTQCPQPRDVAPLGLQFGDQGTPCIFRNSCVTPSVDENRTCNPRDGLATLVAYTTGQEPFTDQNDNEAWDDGEDWEDLSEPYVDANDNGTRDADEDIVDVNKNGKWDDKNGKWDARTSIWRMSKITWTGAPVNLELEPGNGLTLPHCQNQVYAGRLMDSNGNPPTAAGSGDTLKATCDSGCKVVKVAAYEDRGSLDAKAPGEVSVEIADAHPGCPSTQCTAPACQQASFRFDVLISRTLDGKGSSSLSDEDLTTLIHDEAGGSPGPRTGFYQ